MTNHFKDQLTRKIADFLNGIGIAVVAAEIAVETFLPGILVQNGRLLVDESKLLYPGDLLHEAGHLALADGGLRETLSGEVDFPGVVMEPVESQAIAWSYAAALYIGLEPAVVFHDNGYKGNAKGLLLNFGLGAYIGVSGVQAAGLTAVGANAAKLGVPPYPHMIKWVKE
ncbi:hypothetical protein BH10ACI3_BH10ACI3_15100 [soil metagenome]